MAVRNLRDTLLSYPRLVQLSGWGDLFGLANAEGLEGFVKGTFAEAACIRSSSNASGSCVRNASSRALDKRYSEPACNLGWYRLVGQAKVSSSLWYCPRALTMVEKYVDQLLGEFPST